MTAALLAPFAKWGAVLLCVVLLGLLIRRGIRAEAQLEIEEDDSETKDRQIEQHQNPIDSHSGFAARLRRMLDKES